MQYVACDLHLKEHRGEMDMPSKYFDRKCDLWAPHFAPLFCLSMGYLG